MAQKKSSKIPAKNQTNVSEKSIDKIIDKANEAISKYTQEGNFISLSNEEMEIIDTFFRTGKIILLNIWDEGKKKTLISIAYFAITNDWNVKNEKTINCLDGKQHIEDELDKCISDDIRFPYLFLDFLDTELFDSGIAKRLQKFVRKLGREFDRYFNYPPPIIINFFGETPDMFKKVFYGKYVELTQSPESKTEGGQEVKDKTKNNFDKRIFDLACESVRNAIEKRKFLLFTGSHADIKKAAFFASYEYKIQMDKKLNPESEPCFKWENGKISFKGKDPRDGKMCYMPIYPNTVDGLNMASFNGNRMRQKFIGNIETENLSGIVFDELKKIRSPLKKLEFHKEALVLENLSCNDDARYETLEAIGDVLTHIKDLDDLRIPFPQIGMLIITFKGDMQNLPDRYIDLFEIISLEDEKTTGILDAEIKEAGGRQEEKVEKKDKDTPLYKKIPKSTKWTDIDMYLTDKECKTLDISIKKRKPFTVNCRELGLESNHSHKQLKAWWVLIAFAKVENNEIPSSGKKLNVIAASVNKTIPSDGSKLFYHVNKLRCELNKSFAISENPIPCLDKEGVYQTLFRIKDNSYTEEHRQSTQKLEDIKCVACEGLIEMPTRENLDIKGNYICDECKEKVMIDNEGKYPDADEWN